MAQTKSTTRTRYGRRTPDGQPSVDPATKVKDAAPNFGRAFLPQIVTFAGIQSTYAHVYKNPDEAIRHSVDNARFMRNDCSIMESLEGRQRSCALLNWHLEPEDKKDQRQKQLVADLTACMEEIYRFTEYRRNLLEAIWYGRTAIQNRWERRKVRGEMRFCIKNWIPVNGDKLAFRFDDGSGKFDPDQIGVRVNGVYSQHDAIAGDRRIEQTDYGMAYFLDPWERALFTVHKHMIEDGAFEDPLSAGRIHGVGVRDRIYWCWYQKQETMSQLMEVIQRTGTGFTIYYYESGNDRSKQEMLNIAQKQGPTNVILIPRVAGDESMNANGIDRIEPSSAGIDAMKAIVHEFFGHQMKRYILGQILSSESAATGLGSGVADLHQDTFMQIVQYDAVNLEETITFEVVERLKDYNFPWAKDIRIKFKIDTKDAEAESKLQAYKSAWDMGCKIKATDVMDIIGASMPDVDDEVLQNPAMQQQQRLWEQTHPGDMGPDGSMTGQDGQPAPEGSIEDMFGPLAAELGGGEEGGEPGPNDSGGDTPGGPPGPGGPGNGMPQQYARQQVKSSPGQRSMFDPDSHRANAHKWKEELHPRDPGGKFAEKGAGHVSTATEAPGGMRRKQAKSSPGQQLLGLAGDAAEGKKGPGELFNEQELREQPFALSGKPVRGKSLIPGMGNTQQRDLFAGRGDSPGQTSFFDDLDPAAKNVPDLGEHKNTRLDKVKAAGALSAASGKKLPNLDEVKSHVGETLTKHEYEEFLKAAGVDELNAANDAYEQHAKHGDAIKTGTAVIAARHLINVADRDGRRSEAVRAAGDGSVIELTNRDNPNRKMVVHPSAQVPGKWQLTRMDEHGPSGHSNFDTREEAIASAVGAHPKGGYYDDGGEEYEVSAVRGNKENIPTSQPLSAADNNPEPPTGPASGDSSKGAPPVEQKQPTAHDPHLERARGILAKIPKVSAKGLVVQLHGEVSEEHAQELLDKLRGGGEKKAEAEHSPSHSMEDMVHAAKQYQYLAVKEEPDDRDGSRAHQKHATKSALDKWLMEKFGVDAATARGVSNKAGEDHASWFERGGEILWHEDQGPAPTGDDMNLPWRKEKAAELTPEDRAGLPDSLKDVNPAFPSEVEKLKGIAAKEQPTEPKRPREYSDQEMGLREAERTAGEVLADPNKASLRDLTIAGGHLRHQIKVERKRLERGDITKEQHDALVDSYQREIDHMDSLQRDYINGRKTAPADDMSRAEKIAEQAHIEGKSIHTVAKEQGLTSQEFADIIEDTSKHLADRKKMEQESQTKPPSEARAKAMERSKEVNSTPESEAAALARKWKKNEDGTYTSPNGTVWKKAAAGGEESPVTGGMFKGGSLMPIHGKSKVEIKNGAGEGDAPDLRVGHGGEDPEHAKQKAAKKKGGGRKVRDRMGDLVPLPDDHIAIESLLGGHPSKVGRLDDDALAYLGVTRKQANELKEIYEMDGGSPSLPRGFLPEGFHNRKVDSSAWSPLKAWSDLKAQEAAAAQAKDADLSRLDPDMQPKNTYQWGDQVVQVTPSNAAMHRERAAGLAYSLAEGAYAAKTGTITTSNTPEAQRRRMAQIDAINRALEAAGEQPHAYNRAAFEAAIGDKPIASMAQYIPQERGAQFAGVLTPPAPTKPGDSLKGFHKETFDSLSATMTRQLGNEPSAKRQEGLARGIMEGEPPAVQKALADHLQQIAPEVHAAIKAKPGIHLHKEAFAEESTKSGDKKLSKELTEKILKAGSTYLAGDHRSGLRQEIASAIAGKKVSKSEASANAVRTMIEDHLGVTGNSGRDREMNAMAALKNIGGEKPAEVAAESAKQAFDPEQAIKIAANNVKELRKQDVYRVLDSNPAEHMDAIADHVKRNRPELAAEVDSALSDIHEERGTTSKSEQPEQPQHSPALQSAIAQAHQSLHEAGLAEKPEAPPGTDDIDSPSGRVAPHDEPQLPPSSPLTASDDNPPKKLHGRTIRGEGEESEYTRHIGNGKRDRVMSNMPKVGEVFHKKDGPWVITSVAKNPALWTRDQLDDQDDFHIKSGWHASFKAVPVEHSAEEIKQQAGRRDTAQQKSKAEQEAKDKWKPIGELPQTHDIAKEIVQSAKWETVSDDRKDSKFGYGTHYEIGTLPSGEKIGRQTWTSMDDHRVSYYAPQKIADAAKVTWARHRGVTTAQAKENLANPEKVKEDNPHGAHRQVMDESEAIARLSSEDAKRHDDEIASEKAVNAIPESDGAAQLAAWREHEAKYPDPLRPHFAIPKGARRELWRQQNTERLAAQEKEREATAEPLPEPKTASGVHAPPQKRQDETDRRIDLRVPYANKDRAKDIGARWDPKKKVWYAPTQAIADKIRKARLEK